METLRGILVFWWSLVLFLGICALGITTNLIVADMRQMTIQIADERRDNLKLRLDILKAVADRGKDNNSPSQTR